MRWVTPLEELNRDDLATAGGKGANLGELIRGGFPVPEGFVVTTAAYDAYVASTGRGFDAPVPDDIAAAVASAYTALGAEAVVAVRSSATAEDLAEASFAGQQETFLGIHGTDSVLDAVRRCWASLWSPRAVSYRGRAGVPDEGVSLAVVVQRLVDADAAGVLFTANPANGRRHESVINANFGLGEAVVSGQVTPDEIVVTGDRVLTRTVADKSVRTVLGDQGSRTEPLTGPQRTAVVLDDARAVELAALGRRVEAHFGAPQDIEWVLADGAFQLTQSRPITALPAPTGPIPADWPVPRTDGMYMRASIVEQLPDPLSPLFRDLVRPAVVTSLRGILGRYFGEDFLRPGDVDFPTVNDYAYYFYSTAAMGRMLVGAPLGALTAFGQRSTLNGVSLWRDVGLPDYQRVVAEWAAQDPATLAPHALLAGATALVEAGATYYTYVQAVIPQAAMPELAFTRLYDTLVPGRPGVDKPPALTFLLGLDSAPLRAERSLHALAQWCRGIPEVADAVASRREVPAPHAAEFDARLGEHLARFGHLTYNLDVMQPVAADDPAPVVAALAHFVSGHGTDPAARLAHLASERRRAEQWLDRNVDPVRRRLFAGLLEKAHRLGPLREDALADVGLGWPTARRLLHELGARLVDRGVIGQPDDVYWLTLAEARASTTADRSGDVAARKERWRGERLANPPAWLPASGFFYSLFRRWMPGVEGAQTGTTLRGLGASSGQATGPARLLLGPEDFARMQPGDVLVAAITTPAYTPFFALAAAVVTDIGGPLSHSSIVAREYGIPAVLGTGSATHRIHDGDVITVDGERGIVHLAE